MLLLLLSQYSTVSTYEARLIMLPIHRILLLPDEVEVEQTSHHASLYYYRQHHPAEHGSKVAGEM
jgi:hypothetical protein